MGDSSKFCCCGLAGRRYRLIAAQLTSAQRALDAYILAAAKGSVPAMKPEPTAIGITARWPLENNLNV